MSRIRVRDKLAFLPMALATLTTACSGATTSHPEFPALRGKLAGLRAGVACEVFAYDASLPADIAGAVATSPVEPDGAFALHSTVPGDMRVAVTCDDGRVGTQVETDGDSVILELVSAPTSQVSVRVTDPPSNLIFRVLSLSDGSLFFLRPSQAGTPIHLPVGDYAFLASDAAILPISSIVRIPQAGAVISIEFQPHEVGPAASDESVATWLHANGFPLSDSSRLLQMIGESTILGFGEATHGHAESFTSRGVAIKALASQQKLHAILLEAGWAECDAIDQYVTFGTGDARTALSATLYWIFDTEEMIATIEWIRSHNESKPLAERIRFWGIDTVFAAAAHKLLIEELSQTDANIPVPPENVVRAINARIPDFGHASHAEVSKYVDQLRLVVEKLRSAGQTTPRLERAARQLETAISLAAAEGLDAARLREVALADNAVDLAREVPKGKVALLWSHNEHVGHGQADPALPALGASLKQRLGSGYVSAGVLVGEGVFRAWDYSPTGDGSTVGVFELGPPGDGSLDGFLAQQSFTDAIMWDLRTQQVPVRNWFLKERGWRSATSGFVSQSQLRSSDSIASEYDAILFIPRISPSHPTPTPTGIRPLPSH